MAEFIYYEKNPSTDKKTSGRGRKKSFAPVRRAKVEDSIENEIELPFQRKGDPTQPTEDEEKEEMETPPQTSTGTGTGKGKATKVKAAEKGKMGDEAPQARPTPPVSSASSMPPLPSSTTSAEKDEAPAGTKKTKKTTTKVVKKVVKKPAAPSDPAFVREKERFFAHFRTTVEELLNAHAPLDKSVTGRAREVNTKVQEICGEFLADAETTPVPTKQIPEEEYQRHQREEEESLAQSHARQVRCAKLRQRSDLLRKEIERQKKEAAQWEEARKVYAKKSEEVKRAREKAAEHEETMAKRLKTGEIDYPDFLSKEDRDLLQRLKFTPMDVERATQTLSLQVDYLNGTLREIKHFDESADHYVRSALASHHRQWQKERAGGGGSAPNPRALIRDITKSTTGST